MSVGTHWMDFVEILNCRLLLTFVEKVSSSVKIGHYIKNYVRFMLFAATYVAQQHKQQPTSALTCQKQLRESARIVLLCGHFFFLKKKDLLAHTFDIFLPINM